MIDSEMKEVPDMSDSIVTQVIEQLQELPDNLQRRVLYFIQELKSAADKDMPGSQLLRFAGSISHEDLEMMRQAIEEECENVDINEW